MQINFIAQAGQTLNLVGDSSLSMSSTQGLHNDMLIEVADRCMIVRQPSLALSYSLCLVTRAIMPFLHDT